MLAPVFRSVSLCHLSRLQKRRQHCTALHAQHRWGRWTLTLKLADPTFQRKDGQNETAINAKGFEVDFLRRQPEGDDPHPFRFSTDEGDLWPVQARRASVLTNAPRFEHVVISTTGRMTLMRTIAPETFIEFKRWMAEKAPQRPEPKRRRDRRQADIVQALLDEGLLITQPRNA
jgi:hypothetical protein